MRSAIRVGSKQAANRDETAENKANTPLLAIGSEVIAGGSTALVVTFNVLANIADVQAVLRAMTFRSFSQNPTAAPRTLSVFVADGDGGTSATSPKPINVTPVNDRPVNDRPVLGGIGARKVLFTVSDGDRGISAEATKTVNVT